jgi:hypothetical protein
MSKVSRCPDQAAALLITTDEKGELVFRSTPSKDDLVQMVKSGHKLSAPEQTLFNVMVELRKLHKKTKDKRNDLIYLPGDQ